ncbi:exodeoxyribonuclease III [uncultured Mitsuokella sp.]|uniref:exodeoxyribonuclease III n=1 Tax=uncultured Mitsuokella sp. TaxID=453120 RepID=UPI002614444C|nr:exodeoxyribonuclease III [uncultured Mitsuokella sp.]
MKLISWNVNGLRACLKKGFMESFLQLDADIFALQETKMQPEQAILDLPGYTQYWNSAEKKGYSGTAVFSRVKPLDVINGIGIEEHDHEGRVITLEFPSCFFVTVYTPNSKRGLERLSYRMEWEDAFRAYVKKLDDAKPVIICGDLNVAHTEMDLKNPKTNHHNAGFTNEERAKFTELLNSGFIDTFRTLYPTRTAVYTWWSYLRKARDTNAGWRIDYFVASARFRDFILDATIHNEIFGSDHCPVGLEIATSI